MINRALDKRECLVIIRDRRRYGSEEGSQHMFLCRIKENYP